MISVTRKTREIDAGWFSAASHSDRIVSSVESGCQFQQAVICGSGTRLVCDMEYTVVHRVHVCMSVERKAGGSGGYLVTRDD